MIFFYSIKWLVVCTYSFHINTQVIFVKKVLDPPMALSNYTIILNFYLPTSTYTENLSTLYIKKIHSAATKAQKNIPLMLFNYY